jgi:hypothetical protein
VVEQKIRAIYTFEILGKPPEHIVSSLEMLIDKLAEIKGVKVLNKKIHEPKPLSDDASKEFYTTFGEAELEIDSINLAFFLVFSMLPCNVEILEPAEIKLKNFDVSELVSELAIKLHKYDEITKGLVMENRVLSGKLNEIENKIRQAQQAYQQKAERNSANTIPVKISTTMSGKKDREDKNEYDKKKNSKVKKADNLNDKKKR